MLYVKFGFDWPSGFEKFEYYNQRTNGPVNAHMRSVVYTNKHVCIFWKKAPVKGQMIPWCPLFFFIIINILSICKFPASLSLQQTNNSYPHLKAKATYVDHVVK